MFLFVSAYKIIFQGAFFVEKSLLAIVLTFSFVLGGIALVPTVSEAHGHVVSPGSHIFFDNSAGGNLNTNVGHAQWEPQSTETPKNTFITDELASAGVSGSKPLDEQTATRWRKTNITTSPLDITWSLTVQHRTASWNYYTTKNGWSSNQPSDIKNFDKIASVDGKQGVPNKVVRQAINIPTDRKDCHVTYAVWDIGGMVNALYQTTDVNTQ